MSLSQQHLLFLFGCDDSIQFLLESYFSRLLFHFIGSLYPGYANPSALSSTPNNSLVLTFILLSTYLTQAARLPMALFHLLCTICITFALPYSTSDQQKLSKFFPREVKCIPRGSKYPKDLPPFAYEGYLSPKEY